MLKLFITIGFLAMVTLGVLMLKSYGDAKYAEGYANSTALCQYEKGKSIVKAREIAEKARQTVQEIDNADINTRLNGIGILRPDNQL